uniref:Uncharacterized protein n=1 Tax=Parascaris equorum TaxID=6256 RepID=A0A914R561_PAREQ
MLHSVANDQCNRVHIRYKEHLQIQEDMYKFRYSYGTVVMPIQLGHTGNVCTRQPLDHPSNNPHNLRNIEYFESQFHV